MKHFKNNRQRVIAYATMNRLKAMLDQDGEIVPGTDMDVSGETITVTLPPKCVVTRSEGPNGDGTEQKKATQNLYGYAVWAKMVARLKMFSQWPTIRAAIIEAMRDSLTTTGKTTEKSLLEADPELAKDIAELRASLVTEFITYSTSRKVSSKMPLTIRFESNKKAA